MRSHLLRCLILCAAFGVLTGISPRSHAASNPGPVTSEYLHTATGMFFYYKPDDTWKLRIDVSPLKTAPGGGPLYLVASFQNPQGGKPLVSSAVVPAGTQQPVTLSSVPISGMRDGRAYMVTVRVFADKAHTKLLGTHEQPILYHQVSPDILRQLSNQR